MRFARYQLRTTDVAAARAFYAPLLGEELEVVELSAAARARGAPAHWLGLIGVPDVEAAAAAMVARGAARLGPASGGVGALRGPGGAVVGVCEAGAGAASRPVWHVLNTEDVARAREVYAAVFGWTFADPVDLGALGVFQPFAFEAGEAAAGAVTAVEGRTGVHPHWLFHFVVPSLDPAVRTAREGGARVIGAVALPDGARIAACEDPQGAAFALMERPTGS